MTDLHFTAEGTREEIDAIIDQAKLFLANVGALETDAGTIRNPDNVLGPRQGTAASSSDDGEGGTINLPARGTPGRWYLVIRTRVTLEDLIKLTGIGWEQVKDGSVEVVPGASLHPEPSKALQQEFREVVGVWA